MDMDDLQIYCEWWTNVVLDDTDVKIPAGRKKIQIVNNNSN